MDHVRRDALDVVRADERRSGSPSKGAVIERSAGLRGSSRSSKVAAGPEGGWQLRLGGEITQQWRARGLRARPGTVDSRRRCKTKAGTAGRWQVGDVGGERPRGSFWPRTLVPGGEIGRHAFDVRRASPRGQLRD